MAAFENLRTTPLIVLWTLVKIVVAVLFIGWCALHVRGFDSHWGIVLPTWAKLPGLIFLILGGIMILACGEILSTRKIGTPGNRLFPQEFVAFGPFHYVRNPMSLGAISLVTGLGLYVESLSVLIVGLLLFLCLHLLVIYVEEPGLEKRFGESYREYKRSVNRWLPRFW